MCGEGFGSRFGFHLGVLFSDRPESGGSCPVWGWGPTPFLALQREALAGSVGPTCDISHVTLPSGRVHHS